MTRWLTMVSLLLIGVFVAGGLAFGATQAFGSNTISTCGDDLGEIGTCPPFNNQSCEAECINREFFGGECILTEDLTWCCACLT